jgi:hypothetical protein
VGATTMAGLAATIESAALGERPAAMADELDRMERSFDDVRVALRAAAAMPAGTATARG